MGSHLFLRNGREVVDIQSAGLQGGFGVLWNQSTVQLGRDGEFYLN